MFSHGDVITLIHFLQLRLIIRSYGNGGSKFTAVCIILLIVSICFQRFFWSHTTDTVNDLFMCSAFSSWFYYYAEKTDTVILYGVCYGEEVPFASFPIVWWKGFEHQTNLQIKTLKENKGRERVIDIVLRQYSPNHQRSTNYAFLMH